MPEIQVLLIEDNAADAYLLQEYLERGKLASYTVTHVSLLDDGKKAMLQNAYDVIFLDMGLPDAFRETIVPETIKYAKNTPVIVMTGNSDIHQGIESVKAGAQDYLIKGESREDTVERSIHHAIERKRLLVELDKLKEREHQLAMRDPLTGLTNRASLKYQLENILQHAKRVEEKIAVLFIDLDRFKTVNDTMGHDIGDFVLIEVANRLNKILRESDIVSRIGGDEFICVLRDVVDTKGTAHLAQKINAAMQEAFYTEQEELYIGCSIGISIFPDDGNSCDELITIADTAMYLSKEQGRNQHQFADQETKKRLQSPNRGSELRRALTNNELIVYYQPVVDSKTETICSCEALVRWQHPEKGIILPNSFIPEMERSGLIIQLGEYVLKQVAYYWKSNMQQQFPNLRISVNISASHFRQKTFVDRLLGLFNKIGIESNWLDIEITESVILHHEALVIEHFKLLKKHGIGISIDDFGTGYSSFSYLRDYPLSTLKVDKSFVDRITSNTNNRAIVKAISALSEQLGMRVIVEGVETLELATMLRAMHCDGLQGFYYSKPLSPDDYLNFMYDSQNDLKQVQINN